MRWNKGRTPVSYTVQVLGMPLGELVPVTQLGHARPKFLTGRAQKLENVPELLQLAVAREDGLLQCRGWEGVAELRKGPPITASQHENG